jgi:phage protein D
MLKPVFKLEYEKKDITKDVCEFVTRIEYTDYEHGQSDEIQITFEDSQKLWQGDWIPSKGDCLRLYIGYEGEKLLNPKRKRQ